MSFFIATPTRNYGRFLGDAVRSIRGQQDVRVRHHVQDACSDDETGEVLRREAWDGLSSSVEPDDGQCDALNRAFRRVHHDAEHLGWLNADEFYLPHALATVRNAFDRDPSLDVVYGDALYLDEEGRLTRLVAQHRFSEQVLRSMSHLYINTSSTFYRRRVLDDGDLEIDESFRQTMDLELLVRLRSRGRRFGYVPVPLSGFRVHGMQLTARHGTEIAAAEHRRVEELFGYTARPRLGRLLHRLYKVTGGAYRREIGSRRHRGESLRWFADPAAARLCERLTARRSETRTAA